MRGIPRRSLLACFCVLLLNQSLFLTSSEASTFEGISALIPREGFVLAAAQAQPVPATAPPSKKDSKKQKVLHVLNTRHVASDLKGQNIITRLLW
ncbi:MAG: hypothetical protein K8F91_05055, partial [Candidatus Obscuribacterales bacterium]|nr:hypothetical protein [Candidatus Obscuribacterales bacterium]